MLYVAIELDDTDRKIGLRVKAFPVGYKPARMVLLPEIIKLRYLGGARGKYDVILLFHGAKVGFIKGRIKDGINRNRQ